MVRVWYLNGDPDNWQLPNMADPPQFMDVDKLKACTGVQYYKIEGEECEAILKSDILKQIRETGGYIYQDVVTVNNNVPNFEAMKANFIQEHIHMDEEIRLILEGSGYFDVRDDHDQWIRIESEKGDMIILPAGIYHHFSLDSKDYVKAARYFQGSPVWTPYNRPADDLQARVKYLQDRKSS